MEAPEPNAADAASLIEAATRRDRRRDPASPVDLEDHPRARPPGGRGCVERQRRGCEGPRYARAGRYTDFLVICTGRNTRLTKRIAEEVGFKLKQESGILPAGNEGAGDGEWILLDYLDFMVHVFTPEAREFYRLDVLWKTRAGGDGGVN